MKNKNSGSVPAAPDMDAKKNILKELETLTNQGKFEELVNLYIQSFLEIKPDPERLRKIKKKVVSKLSARKDAFRQANLEQIKLKVLNEDLQMQLNMLHNDLTRTIILLVSYMVKHGNDDTTKAVFRWIKEQGSPSQSREDALEKGQK